MDWRSFWDGDHPIYVNERHRVLHAQAIGRDLAAYLPAREAAMLDHGCGEALHADALASRCARLWLFDTAPTVRERLHARFPGGGRVTVLDDAALAPIADASLDLVSCVSVAQYLAETELAGLLGLWCRKLKPGGRLVLADVLPPDLGPVTDALALLRFAVRGGFAVAAAVGLARTAVSPYRKLRKTLGLTRYDDADLIALMAEHGFTAERAPHNVGHNQARKTFVGTRPDQPSTMADTWRP